ncbi:MAG TPA: hypothetical protein VF229_00505 [Burkholderiaceae bacterium]
MSSRRVAGWLLAVLTACLPPPAPAQDAGPSKGAAAPAREEAPQPISRAETLLFMSNHLAALAVPRRLHYEFRKSGSLEAGFEDTVDIDVTPGAEAGTRDGSARFFSGDRRVPYPTVEHVEGNPVLLFYLEREIREMSRLTGGKPDYFRKRIRMALADHFDVREIQVQVASGLVDATQIVISPYLDDPNRARFENLATKTYVFTISDRVPGTIYQVEGRVPASDKGSAAVLVETLTFVSSGEIAK